MKVIYSLFDHDGPLFSLVPSHLALLDCGTFPPPLPHKFLIKISCNLVLIFARVCCQVVMFIGAGGEKKHLATNSAKEIQVSLHKHRRCFAQRATSRCATQIISSHHGVFLRVFIFPAIKCQIFYKTGIIMCSENESQPMLVSQKQPALLFSPLKEASHLNPESCFNRNPLSPCKSTSTSASVERVSLPDPLSAPFQ